MTQVNCAVKGCSYNHNEICYAKRVAIGGKGSTEIKGTCCGTFLNEDVYSNLAEHTDYLSPCDAVTCTVAICRYNAENLCQLQAIQVSGAEETSLYTQTDCLSFKKQQ
ncbi:hypothetical protein CS063_09390 [Sporanaerobium hydrogeniformans]|uniref:Uncharacterized protein n=1 Tax=Sporanaerobium hydrogeniformans TaxID=3072179 RepID=A0AC61DDH3_9FIRM|nr:DUF1540 domain-containing protein [Sporanaerobium hydrogeniformans]PHV70731.1 hypothetical protein CS063_09390 [Sporanaerobium hydrogeniformans]